MFYVLLEIDAWTKCLTVVGTGGSPRLGLPGLTSVDIAIGWESQSWRQDTRDAENRRDPHDGE
jgi:hypothetical protein